MPIENFNKVSCLTYLRIRTMVLRMLFNQRMVIKSRFWELRKDWGTMVLRMLFNQRMVIESSELQILGI